MVSGLRPNRTAVLAAVHCGMGDSGEPEAMLARTLIERVRALNEEIGIPATTDVIREEDIETLVAAAISEGGSYASPRFISETECRNVLKAISA